LNHHEGRATHRIIASEAFQVSLETLKWGHQQDIYHGFFYQRLGLKLAGGEPTPEKGEIPEQA
jgi:hypothetical protein